MDGLPKDIQTLIYRYVHVDNYRIVKQQYREQWLNGPITWSSYDYFANYQNGSCVGNYRYLPKPDYAYVFKLNDYNGTHPIAKLPPNY